MKAYDLSKSCSRASECKWKCNIDPNTLCTPEQLPFSSPEHFFHDVPYQQGRSDLRTVPAQVTTWGLKSFTAIARLLSPSARSLLVPDSKRLNKLFLWKLVQRL